MQKRGAAIKNDTDELTNIVGEEYLALSQINKLEKQRMELMAGAAETVGKPAKDITVSDLLDHADGRQRPLLKALREDLLDILTKLKAQNDENRALIETQLEYIGVMLSNIAGSEDPLNNFYDSGGQ
ncbi:MAG: flagellar protein FlgN, partial [Clostridiales bacterium]|nr:flagellar protein FlgN [Clostridiales bacterium]